MPPLSPLSRHYDWPGGKNGWDSVNDWNVVGGPVPVPEQHLLPRGTCTWTGAPTPRMARGSMDMIPTTPS